MEFPQFSDIKNYICIILNNFLHYFMFKCLGSLVLKAFLASILENIPEKNEIIGILPLSPI